MKAATRVVLKMLLGAFKVDVCIDAPHSTRDNVIVLAPHVDDEIIGCGGTLRKHILQGDRVTVIFLTDGSRSSKSVRNLTEARELEARQATGDLIGVRELVFWRFPDRRLGEYTEVSHRLERTLEEIQPDIVYVPSAWDIHPDHIAAANCLIDGVRFVKREVRIYEVFCPLTPFLFNCLEEITNVFAIKKQACDVFQTQIVSFESSLLLNKAYSSLAHRSELTAAEGFLATLPGRYPTVCKAMTDYPVRPRQITHPKNIILVFGINLIYARKLARSMFAS